MFFRARQPPARGSVDLAMAGLLVSSEIGVDVIIEKGARRLA